jgi:hypothetical protein
MSLPVSLSFAEARCFPGMKSHYQFTFGGSFMKLNRITAALTVSTIFFIGKDALAHAPSVTPDIEIFVSGASAQDSNVEKLFTELCAAGSLDTYFDNANPDKKGANHRAFFCTLDTSKVTGLSVASPKVLFHKRSAGGSAQGVNPLVDKQAIDAMSINNNNNCTKAAGESFYRCSISNTGDLIKQVSDVGVSDVNPGLFRGLNVPSGSKDVVLKDVNEKLVVRSGGALVFGVPVTKALRDALQRAQIDQNRLAADCEGQETEPCMPSLSRYQIASLFAGNIGKWSNIKVIDSAGNSKSLTDYANVGDVTDSKVYLCRRVRGSGTQTQFNAKFLNYPCGSNVAATEVNNPLQGPVAILNSGSGDVNLCLDDYNNGSNQGSNNPKSVKAWAIGLQGTEYNADLKLSYRFIKVDGVAPSVEEAVTGRYMDFAEVTWQWRNTKSDGPTGDKLTIIQKIAADAGRPDILGGIDSKLVHPFGHGGYAAVSSSGWAVPADGKLDINNPVTPYTHAPGKFLLDNCRIPLVDPGKTNAL